jgi:hypothetical protein
MASLRAFVTVLVTVLTLFSGAFHSPAIVALRAQLTVERTSDDAAQGTLERSRSAVNARATKPARASGSDGLASASTASSILRATQPNERELAAAPSIIDVVPRRVRVHVENMVFLI